MTISVLANREGCLSFPPLTSRSFANWVTIDFAEEKKWKFNSLEHKKIIARHIVNNKIYIPKKHIFTFAFLSKQRSNPIMQKSAYPKNANHTKRWPMVINSLCNFTNPLQL